MRGIHTIFLALILTASLVSALSAHAHIAYGAVSWEYPGNWCLNFDGWGDYAFCGNSTIFAVQDLTIETWVRPNTNIPIPSANRAYGMIAARITSDWFGWWLGFNLVYGRLTFGFSFMNVSSSWMIESVNSFWNSSSWCHLAVTYSPTQPSGNLKLYVNGVLDNQVDVHHPVVYREPASLVFGATPFDAYNYYSAYDGFIDEARIWNISRTQSELASTWNRTLNSGEITNPNLIGYWRFDDGENASCQDYSLYSNTAYFASDPSNPQWIMIPEFSAFYVLPLFALVTIIWFKASRKRCVFRKREQ